MRYRELGRSGLSVSEIGYGALGIGESAWVGATESRGDQGAAAEPAVARARRRRSRGGVPRRAHACAEHGVGVIVRVALDEGGLAGRITAGSAFPEDDFRNRYFRDDRPAQVERRGAAICA
ncbi:hypothetical protein GCM10010103_59870 [Streptomyces paradoxus]